MKISNSGIPNISELKIICQTAESAKHDSFLGKYFGRKASIHLTRLFLHTPISANQVTILMFLTGLISATLFVFGNYWFSLAAALLIPLMYILDGSDGEIARFRKTQSLKGVYLDRLSHMITYPYLFIGVTFGVYANRPDIVVFILGFLSSLFYALIRWNDLEKSRILPSKETEEPVHMTTLLLHQAENKKSASGKLLTTAVKIIRMTPEITHADSIMILFLVGAIFNGLYIILFIFGILLPLRWLVQVIFDLRFKL